MSTTITLHLVKHVSVNELLTSDLVVIIQWAAYAEKEGQKVGKLKIASSSLLLLDTNLEGRRVSVCSLSFFQG